MSVIIAQVNWKIYPTRRFSSISELTRAKILLPWKIDLLQDLPAEFTQFTLPLYLPPTPRGKLQKEFLFKKRKRKKKSKFQVFWLLHFYLTCQFSNWFYDYLLQNSFSLIILRNKKRRKQPLMARSKAASKKQQKQQQKRGVDFKVSFMSTYHFYFQFCFCYSLSKADKLSIYLFF